MCSGSFIARQCECCSCIYLRVSSVPFKVVQKTPHSVANHITAIIINCLNNLIHVTLQFNHILVRHMQELLLCLRQGQDETWKHFMN
jgi:hypothetical protein